MELKMQGKDNWNGRTIFLLHSSLTDSDYVPSPYQRERSDPLAIVQQSVLLLTTWPVMINPELMNSTIGFVAPANNPVGYERDSLLVELLTLRLVSNDDRFHLS